MIGVGVVLLLQAVGTNARSSGILREEHFELSQPSEVVAVVTAACEGCSWGGKGHEAAALVLSLNGPYAQHLMLVRGERPEEYRVLLGASKMSIVTFAMRLPAATTTLGCCSISR